jgi:hypothetical protein
MFRGAADADAAMRNAGPAVCASIKGNGASFGGSQQILDDFIVHSSPALPQQSSGEPRNRPTARGRLVCRAETLGFRSHSGPVAALRKRDPA